MTLAQWKLLGVGLLFLTAGAFAWCGWMFLDAVKNGEQFPAAWMAGCCAINAKGFCDVVKKLVTT